MSGMAKEEIFFSLLSIELQELSGSEIEWGPSRTFGLPVASCADMKIVI